MSIALITGSSTGIGYETALTLARAGYDVFATMRRPEAAPMLAQQARNEGLQITVLPMDVDCDESVACAVAEVIAQRRRIDVLINNAGISCEGAVEDLDMVVYRQTMETNFFGTVRCVKAVLPIMRQQGDGCIVNVTSVAGRVAAAAASAYAASKFAIEAFSEILAQEAKTHGVRVVIVEPGVVITPIWNKALPPSRGSSYPHARRSAALHKATIRQASKPDVIAAGIRDVIASDEGILRHPMGSDAAPYITWRASLSDEQWVTFGAQTDKAWERSVRILWGIKVEL